jgi:fructose/tagatose bisphosphate aldolase
MSTQTLQELLSHLEHSVTVERGKVEVKDEKRLRTSIHRIAEISALDEGPRQGLARYLTRLIALALGIVPASIQELYVARGRNEVSATFTVPAMNLRSLAFEAAKAVFRAAIPLDASAFIFEIARSEMNYTDQRPTEYVTSILAAAIAEGYRGPVFIQGDHFQVSTKRYASNPDVEIQAIRDLIIEAIQSGFFNIDIDTSTMVDLSKHTVPEQQTLNVELSAMFTAFIRSREPKGITISVGGEIGEVGGHNSTEEELRAYMDGYYTELRKLVPDAIGISKISIQTGTSHGGVVLPDGSIAKVSVDFNTLRNLSSISRKDYGLGGAVQHGASTLPEEAFGKFVENQAIEIHLATNFMNMMFDRIPKGLRDQMYVYLLEKHASDRKPDMTDEQFFYKVRKNAVGPFKKQTWNLPLETITEIGNVWEKQFNMLFSLLGISGTRHYVGQTVHPVAIKPNLNFYLGGAVTAEEILDLAD